MKLKIWTTTLQPTKYWNDLLIQKVWLYNDDWKWIKWCKLNDELIKTLQENFINLN